MKTPFPLRAFTLLLAGLFIAGTAASCKKDPTHVFGHTITLKGEAPNELFYSKAFLASEFKAIFASRLQESGVLGIPSSDQVTATATPENDDLLVKVGYPFYEQPSNVDYGTILIESLRRYSEQSGEELPFTEVAVEVPVGGSHADAQLGDD